MEETIIETLPTQPGVYLMKDDKGAVLYVGKAKNLKARVKQYFAKNPDSRAMIPFLTAKVRSIDTIVTFSEKEALLLENTLIKKHKPKYNALLKDDKTYISLIVTTKDRWPMAKLVRHKDLNRNEGKAFGPYTNGLAAREALELISTIFPLRECSNRELYSRKRPCLLYHIKRCIAPCANMCSKEEYDTVVRQCLAFLQGKNQEILKELKEEMQEASDALNFEKAGRIYKTILHIERILEEKNSSVYSKETSLDAFGMLEKEQFTFILKLIFREGKLVDSESYRFSSIASSVVETFESFLLQHYENQTEKPKEILIPFILEHHKEMEEILGSSLHFPQKGSKKQILDLAIQNTKAEFETQRLREESQEELLLEMQEMFSLANFPARIDCFDTSNINQSDPVASMVVYIDGKKDNRLSRLYKTTATDDYNAFKEVLNRRYIKAKQENTLPDLIIMDGGKGQLNIALKVLQELEIATVDVIALTKEDARHDKGLTKERVCLVDREVTIPHQSALLFFLQNIRDEAHRRAIEFHRKRRKQRLIKSALDDIAGIGPAKRTILLKHFGSVERIRSASMEELLSVKGISEQNAKVIYTRFHESD
ncbi:MAG: excinuclease ABC subunit UvrC [Chlamydiae bacterium]|nr:excinuclease ABC subunit UvrC [Chlamydiota bacterium]